MKNCSSRFAALKISTADPAQKYIEENLIEVDGISSNFNNNAIPPITITPKNGRRVKHMKSSAKLTKPSQRGESFAVNA